MLSKSEFNFFFMNCKFMAFFSDNPRKGCLLAKIRRDGNFIYGFQQQNTTNVIIPARLTKNSSQIKYVVCPYCKIIITKKALYRHIKLYCSNSNKGTRIHRSMQLSRSLTENIHHTACHIFKELIFPAFRDGIVKETILNSKIY